MFVALPVIAATSAKHLLALPPKSQLSQPQEGALRPEDIDIGVRILRLINTAQSWHKHETGQYATSDDLWASSSMQRLQESEKAELVGLGSSLIASLNIKGSSDIAPGRRLRLDVSKDGKTYHAVIDQVDGNSNASFWTNNTGRIFEGKLLASSTQPDSGEKGDVISGRFAGSAISSLTGFFSSLTTSAYYFCCLFTCCRCADPYQCCVTCSCQCSEIDVGDQCFNCGCAQCRWCCDSY